MIIEIRRHGKYNRKTGGLTLESKKEAGRISRANRYDEVFSAKLLRCIQTAGILGKQMVITGEEFDDIEPGENIEERIEQMFRVVFSLARKYNLATRRILIVTHSNFIAAIDYFLDGKDIPQNFDDLPMIPNLKGIQIEISKQEL